jgi:hypothetical protein
MCARIADLRVLLAVLLMMALRKRMILVHGEVQMTQPDLPSCTNVQHFARDARLWNLAPASLYPNRLLLLHLH